MHILGRCLDIPRSFCFRWEVSLNSSFDGWFEFLRPLQPIHQLFLANIKINPWILGKFCRLEGTSFDVITEEDSGVELSFTITYDNSINSPQLPLNIDKRCSIAKSIISIKIVSSAWWSMFRSFYSLQNSFMEQWQNWNSYAGSYCYMATMDFTHMPYLNVWKDGLLLMYLRPGQYSNLKRNCKNHNWQN